MRLLITGPTGFIGKNLLNKLMTQKIQLYPVSHSTDSNNKLDTGLNYQDFQEVQKRIQEISPTHIIHLASSNIKAAPSGMKARMASADLKMHLNVFEAAFQLKKHPHIVFLGSCEEYGNASTPYLESHECKPISNYGSTKHLAGLKLAQLARMHKSTAFILRPSVVYGPGQDSGMLIPSAISSLMRKMNFLTTSGTQTRDFVYVDDLVEAILKAINLSTATEPEIVNIAQGESIRISRVLEMLTKFMGEEYKQFIKLGSIQTDPHEVSDYRVSNAKSFNTLNWQPSIGLEDGLKRTIQWWTQKLGENGLK